MKKVFSILAIAFLSSSFVSCRQDDMTSEIVENKVSQENFGNRKATDTITLESIRVNAAAVNAADPPKDPPKDRTSW